MPIAAPAARISSAKRKRDWQGQAQPGAERAPRESPLAMAEVVPGRQHHHECAGHVDEAARHVPFDEPDVGQDDDQDRGGERHSRNGLSQHSIRRPIQTVSTRRMAARLRRRRLPGVRRLSRAALGQLRDVQSCSPVVLTAVLLPF